MEHRKSSKVSIQISAGVFLMLAGMLLLIPVQWVLAVVIAAIVHESCHAIAIELLGGNVKVIHIGCRGVVMETDPLTYPREGICAFAGPIGSFALLLLVHWFPRTAICGAIHGLFNLIPLLPLDGGRVLRALIYQILSPPVARKVFRILHRCVWICVCLGCVMLFSKGGIVLLFLGILLLHRILTENPLAKKPFWRYNRRNIDNEVRL